MLMLRQMTTRSCIQHINLRRVVEDIFSVPISTFSALEVGHVMRYINAQYLFTYFLKPYYTYNGASNAGVLTWKEIIRF